MAKSGRESDGLVFYSHLKGHIEALLFTSGNPLSAVQIAQILDMPAEHIPVLIAQLNQALDSPEHGLFIVEVAGGYQLCTKPELSSTVEKLAYVHETHLSLPAMETLAIIAFKQPITRQEIENIRGVNVDGIVNMLAERGLIRETGRKEAIGRPILYGTTDEFLACFGLRSLNDLPAMPEFSAD